ncbi:inositol polyphosphate-4-phosphatase type I A-like isoform X1 [Argopecten irradians]|uniref:inositol polyphosphate-4-phosphatase type I A-like isoform X1 n=1 Tax=Argopecten irradians TaxID=31199 RepID=UPI0037171E74
MRFNSKELAFLARQSSTHFSKEGVLWMKDKHDGLFKKGEVNVERFFRLRGNLLFYFKSKDIKGDPQGVLILERCTIELSAGAETGELFGFIIVYEGDGHTYQFATETEEERDLWIQCLHIASYECLKMQLQSLREQIQARTGRDPISQPPPTDTGMEYETQSGNTDEDPAMELCISCEDLQGDSSGKAPNPLVVLYTIIPPQQNWIQHNHTEVVEKSRNPQFLKTIGFGNLNGVDTCTRVKLTVFHVKERMTGTMSQLGQVIFTLQDLLMAPDMKLNLELQGPDPVMNGHVTVMSWINDNNLSIHDSQSRVSTGDEKHRLIALRRRSKRIDTLRPMYNNITTRTFRFDTTDGSVKLLVHEYMGESKLSFDIPCQLLRMWVDEEKSKITQLQELGQLLPLVEAEQVSQITTCAATVSKYIDILNILANYSGPQFKQSVKKGDKDLEFVPINLHLQRMTVINEARNSTGWYDIITVGAFTAYPHKYKHGGLRRMLQQQHDLLSADATLSRTTKIQRSCDLVNSVLDLKSVISQYCEKLCHVAMAGTAEELSIIMERVSEKVRDLVQICDSSILQEAADNYNEAKMEMSPPPKDIPSPTSQNSSPEDQTPEKAWKWTGSNFVQSPTVEPWEMTRVNTEAALVCLSSMVEDLISNKAGPMDRPKWLGEISPGVIKLKSFIELVSQRVKLFMSFLNLRENQGHIQLMHMIKYRRDVCFSHALTSLIAGFTTNLATCDNDKQYFTQLAHVGVFAEFEGLLSCYGDEMGMLEDMTVALEDLSFVTFHFILQTEYEQLPIVSSDSHIISGMYADFNRHRVRVEVPLPEAVFKKLPESLAQGEAIHVIPVLFNVGINEQASLAERFGDTTLQEKINAESLTKVMTYKEKYLSMLADSKSGSGSLTDLCTKLHYNVNTKKNKNTEILSLAAEICRKLRGIRFTSCKSAKDRTAMSVTLEQVRNLQQEHDLASHVFSQALDCFRSEGVRRENTYKNVGVKKYAFNALQLMYFPKPYRPPNGTYGNVQG